MENKQSHFMSITVRNTTDLHFLGLGYQQKVLSVNEWRKQESHFTLITKTPHTYISLV